MNDKISPKLGKALIKKISSILTCICNENTNNKISNNSSILPFLSGRNTKITIKSYIEHIVKYSKIEPVTLITMLIYIDRLCQINNFKLNFFNIHKIILSSLVLSVKFNEDVFYDNTFYASVGGITTQELNRIEYHFLTLIDFSLFINDSVFLRYYSNLSSVIELDV